MDKGRRMASNDPSVSSVLASVSPSDSSNGASNKCRKMPEVENKEEQRAQAHKELGHQPPVDKACERWLQAGDKCLKKTKFSDGGEWRQQPQVDKVWAQRQVGQGLFGHRPRSVRRWPNSWEKDEEMGLYDESKERADVNMGSPKWPPGFEQCHKREQHVDTGWGEWPPVSKGGEHGKGWAQQTHVDKGQGQEPQLNKGGEQDKGWGQLLHVDKEWERQSPVVKECKQKNGCGQQPIVDKGQKQCPNEDKGWEQHLNKGCGEREHKVDVETGSGHWPDLDKGCEIQTQVSRGWSQCQPAEWPHVKNGWGDHLEREQKVDGETGSGNWPDLDKGCEIQTQVSRGWSQCQPTKWPHVKNGWGDHLEKPRVQDGWGHRTPEQLSSAPFGSNDPVDIAVSALQEMANRSPKDHTPSKDIQVTQTTENTNRVAEKLFSIKLLIDTKAKRVLFAETGKEVIDFIFNILALPVASIVEFITKKNMVGSMGNLYESIESIDSIYLQPYLERNSLLKPVVVLSAGNIPLLPPSVGPRHAKYYRCSNSYHCFVTNLPGTICPKCDCKMTTELSYLAGESLYVSSMDAGYVKGGLVKYLLTDDMYVMPLSTMSSITLLKRFNVVDITFLEEKIVDFGMKEGLELLKAALQSKTVLTEVFPSKEMGSETRCGLQLEQTIMETEDTRVLSENTAKVFSIKILTDSKARRILFAEAEKELIDFLFSLLALPVACLVELIEKKNMVGSMGNLYESVENINPSYIQPILDKKSLLKPKIMLPARNIPLLPPSIGTLDEKYYICSTSFHHSYLTSSRGTKCPSCRDGNYPMHTEMSYVAGGVSDGSSTEDGCLRGGVMYVVTDDLVVIPTPSISRIALLKKFNITDVNILEERTFDFGMQEGLEVLKAALTSKTVLTEVFGKKILTGMQ